MHVHLQWVIIVYYRGRRTKHYSDNVWRVGVAHPLTDFTELSSANLGFSPVKVEKFYRIELNNSLFYCKEYKRTSKTNNYSILYEMEASGEHFALIDFFVEVTNPETSEPVILAVVQHLNVTSFSVNGEEVPHLFDISSREAKCIPVTYIKRKCILIESCSSGTSDVICRIFYHNNMTV